MFVYYRLSYATKHRSIVKGLRLSANIAAYAYYTQSKIDNDYND